MPKCENRTLTVGTDFLAGVPRTMDYADIEYRVLDITDDGGQ